MKPNKKQQIHQQPNNDTNDGNNLSWLSQHKLIGINWTTRLTIILIGTSIFFSLFFALEFIVAKLTNILTVQAATNIDINGSTARLPYLPSSLAVNQVDWTLFAFSKNNSGFKGASLPVTRADSNNSSYISNKNSENKLGINFDLIYEDELQVVPDESHYVFGTRQARAMQNAKRVPIRVDTKLNRLLRAYHVAMPFNPDIWLHSEPSKQLHLLVGKANDCLQDLSDISNQVSVAMSEAAATNRSKASCLLDRVGGQHYKLMHLLDSFGRPEAGTLLGHPFWLGSHLQCQKASADESVNGLYLRINGRPLETRYCIGKLILNSWYRDKEFQDSIKSAPSIKLGLCLPRSCDSLELFQQKLSQSEDNSGGDTLISNIREQAKFIAMQNFNPNMYPADQINLTDIYCLPLEGSRRLETPALLLILSLVCWISFGIFCTWKKYKRIDQSNVMLELNDQIVDIMAIDTNARHFINSGAVDRAPRVVDLRFLDSIRHVGCMGVIGAHVLLTYLTLGTGYSHIIEGIGKDMRTMLLLSLNNVVDTFFVISGLLVAYLTFKKFEHLSEYRGICTEGINQTQSAFRSYLKLVSNRYLRIAPLYLLVYTWTKYLSVHLGSGPMWDYATNSDSLRGMCQRESWLWPLAFASDFKPITQHCIPPAWSLAVDLHFFMVLPLFITILQRSQRLAYTLLGALIVASSAYSIADYNSLLNYVNASDFAKLRLHVFTVLIRYASHAYSQPQNRVGPILIGLVGGHLLFEYERRAIPPKTRTNVGKATRNNGSCNSAALSAKIESGKQTTTKSNESPGKRIPSSTDNNDDYSGTTIQSISLDNSRRQKTLQDLGEPGLSSKWPHWMLGNWFTAVLVLSVLFMLAPTIVQLRERARIAMQVPGGEQSSTARTTLFDLEPPEQVQQQLQLEPLQVNGEFLFSPALLLLGTSPDFDFYLALGGFVLIKPFWSICNCILFLRLATDLNGSALAKLLSLGWWRPLNKLNYAILLIHFEIIAYEAMSRLALHPPITWLELLCKFAFAYLGSLALALPLYILIERPIHRLMSRFVFGASPGPASSK